MAETQRIERGALLGQSYALELSDGSVRLTLQLGPGHRWIAGVNTVLALAALCVPLLLPVYVAVAPAGHSVHDWGRKLLEDWGFYLFFGLSLGLSSVLTFAAGMERRELVFETQGELRLTRSRFFGRDREWTLPRARVTELELVKVGKDQRHLQLPETPDPDVWPPLGPLGAGDAEALRDALHRLAGAA